MRLADQLIAAEGSLPFTMQRPNRGRQDNGPTTYIRHRIWHASSIYKSFIAILTASANIDEATARNDSPGDRTYIFTPKDW